MSFNRAVDVHFGRTAEGNIMVTVWKENGYSDTFILDRDHVSHLFSVSGRMLHDGTEGSE